MGSGNNEGESQMKKRVATLLIMFMLAVSALTGCSTGGTPPDMEIYKVVFYRTGGDVNQTEVFVFEPDLTLERTLLLDSDTSDKEFLIQMIEGSDNVEYLYISETDWQSIGDLTKRVDFMTMPEEIDPPEGVSDAPSYYIQVDTTTGTHGAGGYAAGYGEDSINRRFGDLREGIENIIASSTTEPQQ